MVNAYVLIQTEVGKSAGAAARAIRTVDGVEWAEDLAGPYDVIARVQAPGLDELRRLVVASVQVVAGVTRTLTCIVSRQEPNKRAPHPPLVRAALSQPGGDSFTLQPTGCVGAARAGPAAARRPALRGQRQNVRRGCRARRARRGRPGWESGRREASGRTRGAACAWPCRGLAARSLRCGDCSPQSRRCSR